MLSKIRNFFIILHLRYKYSPLKTKISTTKLGKNFSCGKYCLIGRDVTIRDNVKIGNFSYINSTDRPVIVESNVTIGSFCSIAPGVFIGPGQHYLELVTTHPIMYNPYYLSLMGSKKETKIIGLKDANIETKIGNDVWIGINSIIMPGVSIGNGAVIAAGSVVTKNVPEYSIVAGVPAKVIKYRFNDDLVTKLKDINYPFWEWSEDILEENFDILSDINKYINHNIRP